MDKLFVWKRRFSALPKQRFEIVLSLKQNSIFDSNELISLQSLRNLWNVEMLIKLFDLSKNLWWRSFCFFIELLSNILFLVIAINCIKIFITNSLITANSKIHNAVSLNQDALTIIWNHTLLERLNLQQSNKYLLIRFILIIAVRWVYLTRFPSNLSLPNKKIHMIYVILADNYLVFCIFLQYTWY